MKEPRTYDGRWWIFGKDKPEQFGVLHYSPGERPLLSVKVPQSVGILEIILGKAEKVAFPDVIQGRDKHDLPITLFGCAHPSYHNSAGLASYDFHPMLAILGQELESWNSANYVKVNMHYSLLDQWINQTCIAQKFVPEQILQIEIHPKDALEIKLTEEAILRLNWEFSTDPQIGTFQIKEGYFISLQFSKPIGVQEIIKNYAEVLRRFFTLLIGSEVVLDSIIFQVQNDEGPPIDVELIQRNSALPRAKRAVDTTKVTVQYKEIADKLPVVMPKWFEYHEKLDPVLNLYFAVLFNPAMYIHHEFLFLAQALEVYHNTNDGFVGQVQPKADFNARKAKILNAVPPEEKEWLNEKLHHANQKTLAQRLIEILDVRKVEAEKFIPNLQGFADLVRHTRNYYTHHDQELKEKGKVPGTEEMVYAVSQMQTLLGICMMNDLGITGDPIARLIKHHKDMLVHSVK